MHQGILPAGTAGLIKHEHMLQSTTFSYFQLTRRLNLPGYRTLSPDLGGPAAERVREAERHQRTGDIRTAVRLLEEALDHASCGERELPAWICGRLAAAYRSAGRYEDEVALLERFCEFHATGELATRYIARLSKARAKAARGDRAETGALRTVKEVKSRLRTSNENLTETRRTASGH